MIKRRRIRYTTSFRDRLAAFAKAARERAFGPPSGSVRERMLRKARQADIATHLDGWVNSPGLQPPT